MSNRGRVILMDLDEAREYFVSNDFKSLSILNGKKLGQIIVIPKDEKQVDVPLFMKNCVQVFFDGYDMEDLSAQDFSAFISDNQARQLAGFIKNATVTDTWWVVSKTPDVALSIALALCRIKQWNEAVTLGNLKFDGSPNQYVFYKLCKEARVDCEFSRILRFLSGKYKKNHPEDTEFAEPLSDKEEETIIDQLMKMRGKLPEGTV